MNLRQTAWGRLITGLVSLVCVLMVVHGATSVIYADSSDGNCKGAITKVWVAATNSQGGVWVWQSSDCVEGAPCIVAGFTAEECQCLIDQQTSGWVVPAGPNMGQAANRNRCGCACRRYEEDEEGGLILVAEGVDSQAFCASYNYVDTLTGAHLYADCGGLCPPPESIECDWGPWTSRPDHPLFSPPTPGTTRTHNCDCDLGGGP
jgi:hypothetical protein